MENQTQTYVKGDYVKDKQKGFVGKVRSNDSWGVYVFNARSGQNGYIMEADIEPATKEEYDAQVEERLNPKPKPVTQVTPSKSAQQPIAKKPQTFKWVCLECGVKYNGRACPRCDGEDRVLNTDKDLDLSQFGDGHGTIYPKEG